jgi:membrane fusion protein (multidrug efflux system)
MFPADDVAYPVADGKGHVGMKTSVVAVVLLLLVAAAGYGLQRSGAIDRYWPGLTTEQAARPAAPPQQKGSGNRAPAPVEVAEARQTQVSDDISAIGSLLSEASVDIAPETSGRIVETFFNDGDRTEAGHVLFKLDADLIAAMVADAEAKLSLAEANFRRNEALLKSKNVAQSVYDQAVTELLLARSALNLARVTLSKLTIRAPFGGVLGFSKVSNGAYVTAGTPLVHLEKIDRLKVSFSVPELDYLRLAVGQEVEVAADAVPGQAFSASITAIDPLVDINGRALQVRGILDNSAGKLRPGMLVRVSVKGPLRNALTVPEAAIVPRGNDMIVYLAAEEKAKEARVKTGKRIAGTVEIVEGLDAGAKVVVAGNTRLSDGAAIRIVAGPPAN